MMNSAYRQTLARSFVRSFVRIVLAATMAYVISVAFTAHRLPLTALMLLTHHQLMMIIKEKILNLICLLAWLTLGFVSIGVTTATHAAQCYVRLVK